MLFNKPATLSQTNLTIIQPLQTCYHCCAQKHKHLLLMVVWGQQHSGNGCMALPPAGFLFCCSGWPSSVVKLPAALLPAAAQPTPKAVLQLVLEHCDSFPKIYQRIKGVLGFILFLLRREIRYFPELRTGTPLPHYPEHH